MEKHINNKSRKKLDDSIEKISNAISKLSYEQSMKELDIILNHIQSESLPVQELKRSYEKANLYIQHCENLLNTLEQEIIELDC